MGVPILKLPGQPLPMQEGEFSSASTPNLTTFSFHGVDPPSPVYIQRDDQLALSSATQVTGGDVVTVNVRILQAPFPRGGQPYQPQPEFEQPNPDASNFVDTLQFIIRPNSPSAAATQLNPLTEGYLLGMSITCNGATQRGQTFVRAFISRASSGFFAQAASQPLVSDYATINTPIGWPGGTIRHPVEGPGAIFISQPSAPAAGADWSFTIPVGVRARLVAWRGQLVTSAAAGNRIVRVQALQNSNQFWQGAPSAVIPASQTVQVCCCPDQAGFTTDPQTVYIPFPPDQVMVGGGTTVIRTNTTGLDAADQWTQINLQLETWIDTA